MNCGIIGLPNVGKSALFNLLTENNARSSNYPYCTVEPNTGIAYLTDKRLDKLKEVFDVQKIGYPYMDFIDVAGLPPGASKGEGLGNQFLSNIRDAYCLLQVVRDFNSPDVSRFEPSSSTPVRDFELVDAELFLADLQIAERRIEDNHQSDYWNKTRSRLMRQERPEQDRDGVLLTAKPMIVVVNITTGSEKPEFDREKVIYTDIKFLEELKAMEPAEREEFKDMNSSWESGIDEIMFKVKDMLDMVTFFTVEGGREVKGHNIKRGKSVYEAAGKIHSDMQKSFVKAEVYNYKQLKEAGYMPRKLRESGKIRMEGRDYKVKDGDIVKVMFGSP
ncbi:MAG: DUF933 domain-containing protein [Elusimicrobia bacterium]|jgi:ribosome-binding ATPase YchF (GTP1/OBG family)|nr:DUF933 domain-containing protein [Elusimicrobiota bacterium]